MAAYTIDVRPRARRSLRQLDPSVREAIAQVIDGLAIDPRPPGCLPLAGHRPYLRVRSGDYRVTYTVDDSAASVLLAACTLASSAGLHMASLGLVDTHNRHQQAWTSLYSGGR